MPAHDIERAVIGAVAKALKDRAFLIEQIGSPGASPDQIRNLLDSAEQITAVLDTGSAPERARALRELVARIVIKDDALAISLRRAALNGSNAGDDEDPIRFSVPVQFRRRGVEMKLVIAGEMARPARPDPVLIKAVARAHLWFEDLATGRAASLQAIADCEKTLRLNPCHFGAACGMGQCFMKQKKLRAALRIYRRANRINPNIDTVRESIQSLERMLGEEGKK